MYLKELMFQTKVIFNMWLTTVVAFDVGGRFVQSILLSFCISYSIRNHFDAVTMMATLCNAHITVACTMKRSLGVHSRFRFVVCVILHTRIRIRVFTPLSFVLRVVYLFTVLFTVLRSFYCRMLLLNVIVEIITTSGLNARCTSYAFYIRIIVSLKLSSESACIQYACVFYYSKYFRFYIFYGTFSVIFLALGSL